MEYLIGCWSICEKLKSDDMMQNLALILRHLIIGLEALLGCTRQPGNA